MCSSNLRLQFKCSPINFHNFLYRLLLPDKCTFTDFFDPKHTVSQLSTIIANSIVGNHVPIFSRSSKLLTLASSPDTENVVSCERKTALLSFIFYGNLVIKELKNKCTKTDFWGVAFWICCWNDWHLSVLTYWNLCFKWDLINSRNATWTRNYPTYLEVLRDLRYQKFSEAKENNLVFTIVLFISASLKSRIVVTASVYKNNPKPLTIGLFQ